MVEKPLPQEHVQDAVKWLLFKGLEPALPKIFGFQITKFMVLELIAAGLLMAIFIPLCRWARSGSPPRGAWWNAFESLLTFIRDDVAKVAIGEHDADRYVPYLWTVFLFVLFCNLLGLIPFGFASPTASIWMTGALAACSFLMLHGCAIAKMGPIKYVKSLWPHIDVPYVGWIFSGAIFAIELAGTFIKSAVLGIRLFANMFGGHMALAVILGFIILAGMPQGQPQFTPVWPFVTVASVLGVVALSLLELFIAFLQAYIFVFLTALFMGMALHPAH